MKTFYTDDKATQIIISLLKAHGIKKVIVSPGTTNISFVGSIQHDSFFDIYSSVDERSAGYMACGLAYESGEPVVITCTEATASRNYFSALTEAHYRKLPILAITCNHGVNRVGHLIPQVIDRSKPPLDTVGMSVNIQTCKDKDDEWETIVNVNKAILSLTHNGGGPVHINLEYHSNSFNTKELPKVRVIRRICYGDKLPKISQGKIAIFIGSHKTFTDSETEIIDAFCSSHNAAVFCDKTSGYNGLYRLDYAPVSCQLEYDAETNYPDLIIHIGEVSGETYTQKALKASNTWRVSEDGVVRDTFKSLKYVFQMKESDFFKAYTSTQTCDNQYFMACKAQIESIVSNYPEVGFSNIWIAKTLAPLLPSNSFLHLGIYNSLRSWNFVKLDKSIKSISNVGGFGIDGALSTALGSSLANPEQLHFLVLGDLAFFYDMNALGNRYLGHNLRILLVNNGKGTEFRKLDHPCAIFGDDADFYMAAAGHFGNMSPQIVRGYAESLGITYLCASSKQEFLQVIEQFTDTNTSNGSVLLEVFTKSNDESLSVDAYRHIKNDIKSIIKKNIKKFIVRK